MPDRDFYGELGLRRGAAEADIKKAYRRLARELHPDRNPDDAKAEERFKAVAEAYGVLSDPKKKALYDEFGEVGLREGFDADVFRRRAGAYAGGGPVDFSSFEDLFGAAGFGGSGDQFRVDIDEILRGTQQRGRTSRRGSDLEASVEVAFLDAVHGAETEVRYSLPRSGREKNLKVRIPAGARDGQKVRLRGQGAPGRAGAPAGDLLLVIRVPAHPQLWFEGDDLHLRLPITPLEAHDGAKVPVSTPDGEVQVSIPDGAKSGAKLRLRRKGVARKGQARSDLIVHLEVKLPDAQGRELRSLLQKLERHRKDDVRAGVPDLAPPE
ncbi:MAG: DnaJ C-terminal domain-containing protein [Myxococcota bacterium]